MRTLFPFSQSSDLSGANEHLDEAVLWPDPLVDGYELRDDSDDALSDLATWATSPSRLRFFFVAVSGGLQSSGKRMSAMNAANTPSWLGNKLVTTLAAAWSRGLPPCHELQSFDG